MNISSTEESGGEDKVSGQGSFCSGSPEHDMMAPCTCCEWDASMVEKLVSSTPS